MTTANAIAWAASLLNTMLHRSRFSSQSTSSGNPFRVTVSIAPYVHADAALPNKPFDDATEDRIGDPAEPDPGALKANVDELDKESADKDKDTPKSILAGVGEQMSLGGVLGFATGYSIRKIGKLLMLMVGTEVVILQYMAYRKWISIDWKRIANDLSPKLKRSAWAGALDMLIYKMPFSVAFTGGLAAGLRLSSYPG